jgi:hypothetical protein
MKCDSQASLLAYPFASPYFGLEPKIKVATKPLWIGLPQILFVIFHAFLDLLIFINDSLHIIP